MAGELADSCLKTSTFQSTLPDLASRQSARSDWSALSGLPCTSPCGTAVVMYTLRATITGDDQPRPGTAVRQAMFFSGDHSVGRFLLSAYPCPVGPRN